MRRCFWMSEMDKLYLRDEEDDEGDYYADFDDDE